jgi:hypothetical protein
MMRNSKITGRQTMVEEKKYVERLQIKRHVKATATKGQRAFPNPLTLDLLPDPTIIMSADGTQLYQFDTIRFTIFESGSTQYTLNWNATSLGWGAVRIQGSGPPDIFVEIQDAQGGDLDTWDIGRPDQPCQASHPVVFTNPKGKPNILETNTSALQVVVTIGGGAPSSFFHC